MGGVGRERGEEGEGEEEGVERVSERGGRRRRVGTKQSQQQTDTDADTDKNAPVSRAVMPTEALRVGVNETKILSHCAPPRANLSSSQLSMYVGLLRGWGLVS